MSTPPATPSTSSFRRPNPPLTRTPSHPSPLSNSVAPSTDAITIENADYDAFDALLHSIFAHTQSSSFSQAGGAVCLRVESAVGKDGVFRVFPYEASPDLVRFEENARRLNPAVAVKLKGAAIHAVLTRINENDRSIALEQNTSIQILPHISSLPAAEKDQRAAFIADPQDFCLILWSFGSSNDDGVAEVVDLCKEMEEKLIKYVWRTRGVPKRGPASYSTVNSRPHTRESSHVDLVDSHEFVASGPFGMEDIDRSAALIHRFGETPETKEANPAPKATPVKKPSKWNPLRWWKLSSPTPDPEKEDGGEKRKHVLLGPFYAGTGAGLALYFITSGISVLVEEYILDGNASRFALIVVLPVIYAVSIFFCLQLVGNLSLIFGPVAQYHENSVYYSALPPPADPEVDSNLPHITIQLPVYKESLELTIAPSIFSIKKAMQTYARQGGTSAIFVCDDGLRLISEQDRNERIQFYANHNIGWVARPRHDGKEGGFKRRGKFKKASNMNYGLTLSMKLERHLQILLESQEERDSGEDLEEKALQLAIEEVYRESGYKFKPEASLASSLRVGAIILIIDADTVVPEDCFRDAAREMFGKGGESVGIIQHESDVMQVAHHYFENGITHFTRRINKCISYGCANGEVAPFVGHNAFLRWSAVQDAGFLDPYDLEEAKVRDAAGDATDPEKPGGEVMAPERKMWSESNVSEDFDLALRLLLKGYTLRWATYSNGGFKEGVSLTVVDELARWQKYAYGCDEIIFNPLIQWWRKGPISKQLSGFLMSKAPVHYKIGMTSYMFSYYGIAAATVGSILNYLLLGLAPNLDRFYLKSFEILLACVVVFPGLGNIGFTLLEYRIGHRSLLGAVIENLRWVPFFVFFFGGLSIHLSTAILAHMFSYDMTWGSTGKEVEKSTFWIEVPRILRNFRLSFTICIAIIAMMIIMSTDLIPFEYQIPGWNWALIIPVSLVVGCHALVPLFPLFSVGVTPVTRFGDGDDNHSIPPVHGLTCHLYKALRYLVLIVLNPWLMKFSY
ncbi:hypothetical protein VNI00_010752 [Paramarasmius palmivorus]|uniref:Glycosyltransferase 2-like domain-containing protein n=1 Tax=Paramarasmius palmivorus TaxID=297713 RepID=A0AAW0CHJ9_9AGAR